MVEFLKDKYPKFSDNSKLYFVNDSIPLKGYILESVMSLLSNGNYTMYEISWDSIGQ